MNPETILKATAEHYGIPEEKLKQRRRGPWKISWPRLLAMSLAYEDNTGMKVGAAFNRHYTAVVYAAKRVEDLCERDTGLAKEREQLKGVLCG